MAYQRTTLLGCFTMQSVGFTVAPFFIIAAIWLAVFGLCLCFICLCYCCCQRERYGYTRLCYALSLIFLIFFTISAIVGCIVLYTGQGKFHNNTLDTLDYVSKQANITGENLKNVSEYLSAAKQIGVNSVSLPADLQSGIDAVDARINSSATTLSYQTQKNSKDIKDGLDSMRLSLIVIAAVMFFWHLLGFDLNLRMGQTIANLKENLNKIELDVHEDDDDDNEELTINGSGNGDAAAVSDRRNSNMFAHSKSVSWSLLFNEIDSPGNLERIWSDIGESEVEKDRMLMELERECLEVY